MSKKVHHGDEAAMSGDPAIFTILTVCTGNVCRSPLAERMLQGGLDDVAPGQFSVASAGLGALVGHPVTSQILDIADHFGASVDSHRARQLDPAVLGEPDLILTMDTGHRGRLLEQFPRMLARTFTLREFARILPSVVPLRGDDALARWTAAVIDVRAHRFAPEEPADDDVIDPFRRDNDVYRLMASQLIPAVRTILAWESQARTQ